jgi:hypothetical protein
MQIHYAKILRHYLRQPGGRLLMTILACALIVWQGELVGETLGKALYYLTH